MYLSDLKKAVIEKLLKISELQYVPEDIEDKINVIKDNYVSEDDKKEEEFYWNLSSLQVIELIIELENELDMEFDMEKVVEFKTLDELLDLIANMIKEKEG